MKHTLYAPWTVRVIHGRSKESVVKIRLDGMDGRLLVAEYIPTSTAGDRPEVQEHLQFFKLMAAAPELLAEAEGFLEEFDTYINTDCELPDPCGLIAAVAKATGQASEQSVQATAASAMREERLQEVNAKLLAACHAALCLPHSTPKAAGEHEKQIREAIAFAEANA